MWKKRMTLREVLDTLLYIVIEKKMCCIQQKNSYAVVHVRDCPESGTML